MLVRLVTKVKNDFVGSDQSAYDLEGHKLNSCLEKLDFLFLSIPVSLAENTSFTLNSPGVKHFTPGEFIPVHKYTDIRVEHLTIVILPQNLIGLPYAGWG